MHSYEYIKSFFEENDCFLISKKYKGTTKKLTYKCACGEIIKKSFANFRRYPKCQNCVGKKKHSLEEVRNIFSQRGCKLLTIEYKDNDQVLEYICVCGKKAKIRLRGFKEGSNCRDCATKKMMETQRNNYEGRTYFQTEESLSHRRKKSLEVYGTHSAAQSKEVKEKKKKTCLKKYGVEFVSQLEETKQKSRETCLKKYGVEYCHQSEEVRNKHKKTLLERYGVPSLAYLSRCASKESQRVFWVIFNALSDDEKKKTYFAECSGEFVKKKIGEDVYFKYDFVNSLLKKCIEYNGSKFHPKPEQDDEEIGWCVFHPDKTVREAREYELDKISTIKKDGYDVLVVWDYEFKNDFEEVLARCLSFLKGVV